MVFAELILLVLCFFLGASFASFINVVAGGDGDIRENLSRNRSVCESCDKPLRWWELVPVVSWLALGGRCKRCGGKVPFFHVASEVILGTVFILTFLDIGPDLPTLVFSLAVAVVLYFFSVYDIFHRRVPNKYLLPVIIGVFVILIITAVLGLGTDWRDLIFATLSGLGYSLFFFVVNLVSKAGLFPGVPRGKEGFGWGDAKLAFLLGLILGWPQTFVGLWVAVFAGGAVGVIILLLKHAKRETMPFVPFLSLGAWVAMLWGIDIMEVVEKWIMY